MKRVRQGASSLACFGALVLSAASCGGDDEGGAGGAAKGGAAGKGAAGSGGKGSSGAGGGGRAGGGDGGNSAGEAGAASDGGDGHSGGEGGSQAGAGGGDGADEPLTVRDEATAAISAEGGGTLTLGRFSLEIPPNALEADTEITIKSFVEDDGLFVLEPDGLAFETPIRAHFTLPATSSEEDNVKIVLAETAALGEPSEIVGGGTLELTDDDEYRATIELEHFSFVKWFDSQDGAIPPDKLASVEEFTLIEAAESIPIGMEFGLLHGYSAPESPDFAVIRAGSPATPPEVFDFHLDSVVLLGTEALASADPFVLHPPGSLSARGAPAPLGATPLMVTRLFQCVEEGQGIASVHPLLRVQADITRTVSVLTYDSSSRNYFRRDLEREQARDVILHPFSRGGDNHSVGCVDGSSVFTVLSANLITEGLVERFREARENYCYDLSDDSSCEPPDPDHALVNVLGSVIQVGPDAANRIEAAFPCGEGPLGTTVCGAPSAFAEGEYVFVLATLGADIPTADPLGTYQHAVVFDADGVTKNNYVPSPQYPKDFFQDTDKWYQLSYTPAGGFSLRVVDARVSVSNPVASGARLLVAGREFAAFIPRAELDGTEPGFRVSTFRHEGDYGLSGGPWDASYHPPLEEPLLPAADGEPFVLPED
jgi:hypothetical protein